MERGIPTPLHCVLLGANMMQEGNDEEYSTEAFYTNQADVDIFSYIAAAHRHQPVL